jgi:hypothetical protein
MSHSCETERERYWQKWAARRLKERRSISNPVNDSENPVTASENNLDSEDCVEPSVPELTDGPESESEPESDDDELFHLDFDLQAERQRYYVHHHFSAEPINATPAFPRTFSLDSIKDEFMCNRVSREPEPSQQWLQRSSRTMGGVELMEEEKQRFTYQTGIETDAITTRWEERRSGETWIDAGISGGKSEWIQSFD